MGVRHIYVTNGHHAAAKRLVPTGVFLLPFGFFGHSVSENLRSRIGNLVILPYYGESVWWYEKNRFDQNMLGHHGGLTREEMEIPLLALCL